MSSDRRGEEARCSVCELPLSPLRPVAGQCEHPACSAPICRTCFAVRGRRLCPQHAQAGGIANPQLPIADRESEIGNRKSGHDAEALWAFLREARAAELSYTSRFRTNTESRASLPIAGSQERLKIRDWDAIRSTSDEAPQMKRLLPEARPISEVRALCPVNVACRYTIRKPPLVVEAACCGDLEAFVRRGKDAPPVALDALLKAVSKLAAEAKRRDCTTIAGLFSLTGWDAACTAHVRGGEGTAPFVHPDVSVCLVGPGFKQVHANANDRRLQLYLPLFRGETLEEQAARCKPGLLEELFARDRVFVSRCATENGFTPQAALLAAQDIARERSDVDLIDVEDAGPTLKWRK